MSPEATRLSATHRSATRPTWLHWVVLFLLAISVAINYVDRGNLSVALSSIEKEIHLGKDELGILGMAFFVSYSVLQIFAGKLIDRFNVIWVYALGYLVWQVAHPERKIGGRSFAIL